MCTNVSTECSEKWIYTCSKSTSTLWFPTIVSWNRLGGSTIVLHILCTVQCKILSHFLLFEGLSTHSFQHLFLNAVQMCPLNLMDETIVDKREINSALDSNSFFCIKLLLCFCWILLFLNVLLASSIETILMVSLSTRYLCLHLSGHLVIGQVIGHLVIGQ